MDVGRHPNIGLLAYSKWKRCQGRAGDFSVDHPSARPVTWTKASARAAGPAPKNARPRPRTTTTWGLAKAQGHLQVFRPGHSVGLHHRRHVLPPLSGQEMRCVRQGVPGRGHRLQAAGPDRESGGRHHRGRPATICSTPPGSPNTGTAAMPNVMTALEFERFLSASGPTHGHVYRPSDLAAQGPAPGAGEGSIRSGQKALESLEKKFGQTSDDFYSRSYLTRVTYGQGIRKGLGQVNTVHGCPQRGNRKCWGRSTQIDAATRLAFIQCVGSRDIRFNRHCSGFCCMHAIKEAIIAKRTRPRTEVHRLRHGYSGGRQGF